MIKKKVKYKIANLEIVKLWLDTARVLGSKGAEAVFGLLVKK